MQATQSLVHYSKPPAVQEYQDFQRHTGPLGGWSAEDHAEFLKVLQACQGNTTHVLRVCEELMIQSSEAVTDHIRHALMSI